MPTITDLLAERYKPNILGYGVSMGGKTRFITTLKKVYPGKTYIFNFDPVDNLMPIVLTPGMGDIEYEQYDDFVNGYDHLLTKIVHLKRQFADAIKEGKEYPYALVCVENGNVLHQVTLASILKAASRIDSDGVRIQDWGLAAERVKKRLKEILDLPCPVYVTFHQQLEKEEIFGRAVGRILVPGRYLPEEIPPMFNMFLRFTATPKPGGGMDYKVQCANDGTFPAGDKTGSLDTVEEPDFTKMAAKIGSKLTAARLAAGVKAK